jgi:hypothetical protein
MEAFERVAYDEAVCPPGHHPPGFRQTAESMLKLPDALGGVQWTSLNNAPPGTSAFHFDIKHDPPRLLVHPELKEWFTRVSSMRPRAWDDRALLSKLQGSAIAHAIREFESEGASLALQKALKDMMGDIGKLSGMKELEESEALMKKRCRRLEDEVKALRTQMSASDWRVASLEVGLCTLNQVDP